MKVVCIGGGIEAPTVMAGPRADTEDITGLIAVTDSGRSTGEVRIAERGLLTLEPTDGEVAALVALLADRRPRLRALS